MGSDDDAGSALGALGVFDVFDALTIPSIALRLSRRLASLERRSRTFLLGFLIRPFFSFEDDISTSVSRATTVFFTSGNLSLVVAEASSTENVLCNIN